MQKHIPKSIFNNRKILIAHTSKLKRIENVFSILNKRLKEFGGDIRYFDSMGRWFKFERFERVDFIKNDNRWLMTAERKNENDFWINEFIITDIYRKYSDNSQSNYPYDFILFRVEKDEPYLLENEKVYIMNIFDEKHPISFEEIRSGYALIDDEAVSLDNKKFEEFYRQDRTMYFLLTTKYHYLDGSSVDESRINRIFFEKISQKDFTITPEILVEYCEEIKELTKNRMNDGYDHNMNLSAIKLINDPRRIS